MAKMNPAQGLGLRVDEPIVSRVQSAGLCDGARQAAEGTLSMKKLILFTAFAITLTASPVMPQMTDVAEGILALVILEQGNVLHSSADPYKVGKPTTTFVLVAYAGKI